MASGTLATADYLRRGQDLILPIAIIASVLVILVPLPPALMDLLLAGARFDYCAIIADADEEIAELPPLG